MGHPAWILIWVSIALGILAIKSRFVIKPFGGSWAPGDSLPSPACFPLSNSVSIVITVRPGRPPVPRSCLAKPLPSCTSRRPAEFFLGLRCPEQPWTARSPLLWPFCEGTRSFRDPGRKHPPSRSGRVGHLTGGVFGVAGFYDPRLAAGDVEHQASLLRTQGSRDCKSTQGGRGICSEK